MRGNTLGVAASLLWFGRWGMVVGDDTGEVAYHRVCCRQDADVKLHTGQDLVPTLEHLIKQFDSDYCVHTFGSGTFSPNRRGGLWPDVTHDRSREFESHYVSSKSKRRRSRSSSRDRSSSRGASTSADLKCATVEVIFGGVDSPICLLDVFTQDYIEEASRRDLEVRIGTGRGSWNGKEIVGYEGDDYSKPDGCDSVISKPMIESAVKSLGTSLDPKAVVRFLEFATNSRVPISSRLLSDGERAVALTKQKLENLNFNSSIQELCKKMDKSCLQKVQLKYLTPNFVVAGEEPQESPPKSRKRFFSLKSSKKKAAIGRGSKRETGPDQFVNLAPLNDVDMQKGLLEALVQYSLLTSQEPIYEYFGGESHELDLALMKAFLTVSGTSYADLHNRAMQRRLSSKKHWMLAACADRLVIKTNIPRKATPRFLHRYFQFELEGRTSVSFLESATLANIPTKRMKSPTCAVLAGELKSLDALKPAYGDIDVWIAYFTRKKKDKVFRSITGEGNPWEFFQRSGLTKLHTLLREMKEEILSKRRSPPGYFAYNSAEYVDSDDETDYDDFDLDKYNEDFPRNAASLREED